VKIKKFRTFRKKYIYIFFQKILDFFWKVAIFFLRCEKLVRENIFFCSIKWNKWCIFFYKATQIFFLHFCNFFFGPFFGKKLILKFDTKFLVWKLIPNFWFEIWYRFFYLTPYFSVWNLKLWSHVKKGAFNFKSKNWMSKFNKKNIFF